MCEVPFNISVEWSKIVDLLPTAYVIREKVRVCDSVYGGEEG